MNRLPGWESKLAEKIASFEGQRFQYGKFDCFIFSFGCLQAITGVDWMEKLDIEYSTKFGATKILRDRYNGSLLELVDSIAPRKSPQKLQRGNIVAVEVQGESVGIGLGVYDLPYAKFAGDVGLTSFPKRVIQYAWDT